MGKHRYKKETSAVAPVLSAVEGCGTEDLRAGPLDLECLRLANRLQIRRYLLIDSDSHFGNWR